MRDDSVGYKVFKYKFYQYLVGADINTKIKKDINPSNKPMCYSVQLDFLIYVQASQCDIFEKQMFISVILI